MEFEDIEGVQNAIKVWAFTMPEIINPCLDFLFIVLDPKKLLSWYYWACNYSIPNTQISLTYMINYAYYIIILDSWWACFECYILSKIRFTKWFQSPMGSFSCLKLNVEWTRFEFPIVISIMGDPVISLSICLFSFIHLKSSIDISTVLLL